MCPLKLIVGNQKLIVGKQCLVIGEQQWVVGEPTRLRASHVRAGALLDPRSAAEDTGADNARGAADRTSQQIALLRNAGLDSFCANAQSLEQ